MRRTERRPERSRNPGDVRPYRCESHVSWDGRTCSECGRTLEELERELEETERNGR